MQCIPYCAPNRVKPDVTNAQFVHERPDQVMEPEAVEYDPQALRWLSQFSRTSALLMTAVSAVILVGISWDVSFLGAMTPGQQTLTPATVIAFALSGTALLAHQAATQTSRGLDVLLSTAVVGLGLIGLFQSDGNFDHLFGNASVPVRSTISRRMSELAALGIVGLGSLGLLLSFKRWIWVRESLALALIASSTAGLASYAFALSVHSENVFGQLAIHKSVLLLVATLGWMASAPTTGLARVLTLDTLGGTLARRLVVPSLLLPLALTLAFQALQKAVHLSETMALTFAATFTGALTVAMVVWVSNMVDRTERQRRQVDLLWDRAMKDALTGLANRRAFDAALGSLQRDRCETGTTFSLLMLDLDAFKQYNDDFGHQAGDEALRNTGRLLSAALRPSDLPARYGGEEFVVLLPATDIIIATRVADRIVSEFRAFPWAHRVVTVSIGVAEAGPDDGPFDLVRCADDGLYAAKRAGRNRAIVGSR